MTSHDALQSYCFQIAEQHEIESKFGQHLENALNAEIVGEFVGTRIIEAFSKSPALFGLR